MFSQFFLSIKLDQNSFFVAWIGAVLVVSHAAVHGWIKFAINDWYRHFYDLLETAGGLGVNSSITEDVWISHQYAVGVGLWEFSKIAIVAVVVMPLSKLIRSLWALRWRLALMQAYMRSWDCNRLAIEGASQRVHEDSYRFAKGVELCLSAGLDAVITLGVFIPILNQIGSETSCPDSMATFEFMGNAWLVGVAVSSATVGLLVTMVLGHRLVGLEIENQKIEAVLRRDLVILETTPEKVCMSIQTTNAASTTDSDATSDSVSKSFLSPFTHFIETFDRIRSNYDRLFLNFTALNLWLAIFDQFNTLLPYMIFAPLLFAPDLKSRILLGTLIQVSNSFDKVFTSLNVIAENWGGINEFRSVIVRLRQFERNIFETVPKRRSNSKYQASWRTLQISTTQFEAPIENVTQATELHEVERV